MESVAFEGGSGLRRIDMYAFNGCRIGRIVIPKLVEVIGPDCFKDCQSLRSVEVEEGSRLVEIDGTMVQTITLFLGHASPVAIPLQVCRIDVVTPTDLLNG
jgi:hypothetical protein